MSLLISSGILPSYAQEIVTETPAGTKQLPEKQIQSAKNVPAAVNDDENSQAAKSAVPAVVRPLNKVVNLPNKGKVWVTEDPSIITPNLSVSAPSSVGFANGKIVEPLLFNVYTNYAPFIKKAEILVYAPEDVDRTKPAAIIPVKWDSKLTSANVEWSGADWAVPTPLEENQVLSYNLRVYDNAGVWDETSYRTVRLLSLANREKEKDALKSSISLNTQQNANQNIGGNLENYVIETEQYGTNALLKQNIQVNGSRVRVRGNNIPEGYSLAINGNNVPVDTKRQFVTEYILPVGKHQLDVQIHKPGDKEGLINKLDVDVSGKYFFLIGLADLTVSESRGSGNLTAVSPEERERFDSVQTDGRLAFYLKGKIQGKYLLTAQADTREKEIDKLFTGFFKADAQDLFRRIDPDLYYPVYGDDSTTVRDVDTQGRLYVRLDWDKNQVLWGNFNTEFNDTNLTQFNRGLYGAKVQLRSNETTELGDPKTQFQAFASEQQTAPGHSEFLGTGGSLYYLKNTDVLSGSEQVSVVIRDKDSDRVLGETKLVPGRDYEMDAFQGRLILNRPLQQIVRDQNIILDNPNSGDKQVLVVNYEYFPDSFDSGSLVAGVKAKQWFGDHFAAGATYVEDRRSGEDYKLEGVDLTFQKGKGTYLKFENANSESFSAPIFYSDNGGFSFFEVPTTEQRKGESNSLEGSLNFKELGITSREALVKGWYIEKDAGFSNSRIDNVGLDVKDWGVEGGARVSDSVKITAGYRDLTQDGLSSYSRLKRSKVNSIWTYAPNQSVSAEFQRVEENDLGINRESSLAGIRFNNRIGNNLDVYVGGQTAFDRNNYDKNDAYVVGGKYTFNNLSTIGLDYVNGSRGNALTATGEYRRTENHTIYSSYTYSPDSTISNDLFGNRSYFKENGFTVGQRWQVTDKVRWTNESQWIKDSSQKGLVHNFGLEFAPRTGWNIGFNVQRGTLDSISTGLETKREAYSINAGFTDKTVDWNSKLEYRKDSGSENRDQWVTTNRVGYKLSEDWRFMGRLNYSRTTNETTDQREAQLIESGIGFSYRPLGGRWNALGKYTYLYDLGSPSQTGGANYDQRSQIVSVEGTYEANPRWEYAGKLAYRLSEARFGRGTGDWYSNNATFGALQARYHIGDRGDSNNLWSGWSALGEYRALKVKNDGIKSGFLVSVDKDVNKYMKVGLGYNFTDYSSDLTDLDYDHKGWFLNILGRF